MKKRKFILLGVAVVLIALLLEAGILNNVNNRNTYQTSQVLLDRVINVLDRNTQSEEELINSLKDDYIVRAKAVAYIIDAKPEAEKDVDELRKIANLMSVDEVHLFDKDGANGAKFSLQNNFRWRDGNKDDAEKAPSVTIINDIPRTVPVKTAPDGESSDGSSS